MQKIDMGGFINETIEVEFAGKVYEIMSDPPIEAYRMFIELGSAKFDNQEAVDKAKEFIATLICANNKVDKDEFKKSLTLNATLLFINQYDKIIAGLLGGGQKKEVSQDDQKTSI